MDEYQVIAVELPYLISYRSADQVTCCIIREKSLYLYTSDKDLVPLGKYAQNINHLLHVIREGRYEWTDFSMLPGQTISRGNNNEIIQDDYLAISFQRHREERSRISENSLKHFNDFLKISNRHSAEMQFSLNQAYYEGVFRAEIEEIVSQDKVYHLNPLDKEIVVRSRLEGTDFLRSYVDRHLATDRSDRYLEINYFFRRVFDLEVNNYISFPS